MVQIQYERASNKCLKPYLLVKFFYFKSAKEGLVVLVTSPPKGWAFIEVSIYLFQDWLG